MLRWAMRQGLLESNPFEDLVGSATGNPERMFFVTREVIGKVIEACPDHEWRLIIALCRYGALRCPSEVLLLKWSDIDWEKGVFRVHSSKTEHHEGKASRLVPIFPELHPYLLDSYEQAKEGSTYCITRYRSAASNLRTQFMRIIHRAGLNTWPKLFQNLRSTRETELVKEFPVHIVTKWVGHDPQVALRHYLQIREEDFLKASYLAPDTSSACNVVGKGVKRGSGPATLQGDTELKKTGGDFVNENAFAGAAYSGAVALQNAVQQASASGCCESQELMQVDEDCGFIRKNVTTCESKQLRLMAPVGLEPTLVRF
ncbi:site-specific integrase [Planctomycetota bacterium]|nr:site-specific integrase [Planctomycetota bacterium]